MAFITLARNVRVDTESTTHSAHIALFLLRELYLLGYWQEMEKDSDTGWTAVANILAEPTDLAVAAATELEITSASTPFTGAMDGQFVSLYASDNANRGLYRINKVISSSRLILDTMCRPDPWVDESGISAKIHNAGKSDYLATGSYFVMRAPSATSRPTEVKVTVSPNAYTVEAVCYPLGDYFSPPGVPSTPGLRTVTDDTDVSIAQTTGDSYFNAYITDPAGSGLLHHVQIGSPSFWSRLITGELEDVATGDDYPGFVNSSQNAINEEYIDSAIGARLRMLDDTNVPMDFWPTWFGEDENDNNILNSPHRSEGSLLMKDKAPFWKPNVLAPNVSGGGYVRGTLPYYTCNPNQPVLFPIDTAYFHLRQGVVIPRTSTLDKVLRGLR